MSFSSDLQASNVQVQKLVEQFKEYFPGEITILDIKEYDILLSQTITYGSVQVNKELSFEIKDERRMSGKTGNHFLEIESRGEPSGISTTQSDYWVIQITDDIILTIPTKEMVRFLSKTYRTVSGGDMNTSKGILVPIKDIINNKQCLVFYGQKPNIKNTPNS